MTKIPNNLHGDSEIGDYQKVLKCISSMQSGREDCFDFVRDAYQPLLVSCVSDFLRKNSDYDAEYADLMQEASLALYKAAMRYDLKQEKVTFGLYAKICLKNRMISLGRKQRKLRDGKIAEREMRKATRTAPTESEPLELPEELHSLFSPYEQLIWSYYRQGMSYAEIADKVGRPEKSVNNAIYRLRKKIKNGI